MGVSQRNISVIFMKKIFLLFVFVFLGFSPVFGVTLKGKITYTVDSAREILFEDVPMSVDASVFSSFKVDPDFKENKECMKNGIEPDGRILEVFKRGGLSLAYAVQYDEKPNYSFYFLKMNGVLAFFDINDLPADIKNEQDIKFPIKSYRYDFGGELIAAGLYVSENEYFLYDKKGRLISHRVGNIGYNRKGRKIWSAE